MEAIEFFEGLEADNSKTYWQEHKAIYEQSVRAPMDELLAEMAPEFGEPKVFRPYRDVRFSNDKSPYKTAIAASLAGGGYVQLTAEGLGAGSGMYMMAPDQLERYRSAVAAGPSGNELTSLIGVAASAGIDVSGHEVLKRAPRGYPSDHERIDLLRNKGLVAWKQWPAGAWLGRPSGKTRIVAFLRAAGPLNDWLAANVGPSTLPDAGRR